MCEYNENRSRTDNSAEVIYSPDKSAQKTAEHSFKALKLLGALLCMAAVSAGSIWIYTKTSDNDNGTYITHEIENDTSEMITSAVTEVKTEQVVPAEKSLGSIFSKEITGAKLTVPEIVKKAKPSVVGISSEFTKGVSTGTGIIFSDDGYIITNAHVVQETADGVSERAEKVTAVLSDNSEYSASIIGADCRTDLAVIKISPTDAKLTAAEFGCSDELTEGELAVAIGNPLGFELYGSTTCGIISALNRKITVGEYEMTLIQTDAAINPGNSGGPLLNGSGQVIGINSSKIISDYAEGLGFAIPISSAEPIIDDLIKNGYVTGRAMIGISGEDIGESTARYYNLPQGVCVRFITPESAAANSGIETGDIIIGINGEAVETMEQLNKMLDTFAAGDTVSVSVYRPDSETQFELKLILDESKM